MGAVVSGRPDAATTLFEHDVVQPLPLQILKHEVS
jgi:hypothetical protein